MKNFNILLVTLLLVSCQSALELDQVVPSEKTASNEAKSVALCATDILDDNNNECDLSLSLRLGQWSTSDISWTRWEVRSSGDDAILLEDFSNGYSEYDFVYDLSYGPSIFVFGEMRVPSTICQSGRYFDITSPTSLGCNFSSRSVNVIWGKYPAGSGNCRQTLSISPPPSGHTWVPGALWRITFSGSSTTSFAAINPDATFEYDASTDRTTMVVRYSSVSRMPQIPMNYDEANISSISFSGVSKDANNQHFLVTGSTNSVMNDFC